MNYSSVLIRITCLLFSENMQEERAMDPVPQQQGEGDREEESRGCSQFRGHLSFTFRSWLRMRRGRLISAGQQRDFRAKPEIKILILEAQSWKPEVSKPEMQWSLHLQGLSAQPGSVLPARKTCLQKHPDQCKIGRHDNPGAKWAGSICTPPHMPVHTPQAHTHLAGTSALWAAEVGSLSWERECGPPALPLYAVLQARGSWKL